MGAVFRGRAAEGIVCSAAEAVSRGRNAQESAGELFVPDADVSGRRRVGVAAVGPSAVAVIESVARIIDQAAAGRIRAVTNVSRVGEAVAEDDDLAKGGRRLLSEGGEPGRTRVSKAEEGRRE